MAARDLCTLADVTALTPGYKSDLATDALLASLMTSESRSAHEAAQREFVTIDGATTRQFDLNARTESTRRVYVGDMTTVTTVTVKDQTGATVQTVGSSNRVSMPRVREEWQPITHLWFPPASSSPAATLGENYVLEVVGVWGFPVIPADLVTAIANMVLVRYISDAADSGTALAEALNELEFNAAAAFAYAQDVIRRYSRFPR